MPPTGLSLPSCRRHRQLWPPPLLEAVAASVADLQTRITPVERNAVTTSSAWQTEGDQLQFEDFSRFLTRYESVDVDADSHMSDADDGEDIFNSERRAQEEDKANTTRGV
jgi:hypothetical protein